MGALPQVTNVLRPHSPRTRCLHAAGGLVRRAAGASQARRDAAQCVRGMTPQHEHGEVMRGSKGLLVGVLLLAAAPVVAQEAADAAATGAEVPSPRLRLFGQNGVGVVLYTNTTCTRKFDEKIRASGSMGSAFGSMLGKVKNEALGIPETATTRSIGQRGMLLSKAYFREYPLQAGTPVVVEAGAGSPAGWRCDRLITATFTPEDGKDYEAAFDVDFSDGVCTLKVNAVAADGRLSRVPVVPASADCAAPATAATEG